MKSMNRKSLTLTLGAIAAVSLLASGSVSALTVKAEPFQQTESPWDMSFLKDGTMFFTEKCKGLSVRLPSGSVNRLLGVGDSSGYS
jgi:aldose sugar dehydrogenase